MSRWVALMGLDVMWNPLGYVLQPKVLLVILAVAAVIVVTAVLLHRRRK